MADRTTHLYSLYFLVLLFNVTPIGAAAQSQVHGLSIGGYHSSGDYGEDTDTRILYFPVSYEQQVGKLGIRVTAPYLNVDGSGYVLVSGGGVSGFRPSDERVDSDGLGDVTVQASYQLDPLVDGLPFLDLVLEMKIPTADETLGLGTGESDYSLQLDLYQSMLRGTVFGSLGYRFRGKTDLYPGLSDSIFTQIGYQTAVSSTMTVGLIYDYSEPASDYSKDIHELLPFINWNLNEQWSVLTYTAWGFTTDSPEYALGIQLNYRW